MASRTLDARRTTDVDLDQDVRRAATAEPVTLDNAPPRYRPGMPTDARSLTLLQRSAGNAAVAHLVRSRTPNRPPPPPLALQRFAPAPAPASPGPLAAKGDQQDTGPDARRGGVDESEMIGTSGGGGASAGTGGGAGRARPAGPPPGIVAKAERAAIIADAAVTQARLGAELASSQARLGGQVGAAKSLATNAVAQATATARTFLATTRAEVVGAATAAEQSAVSQAAAMTAMAHAQAAATHAQLNASAADLTAGVRGRVAGFADRIVGVIGGLSLPDVPGVSHLRSAATGLVRRAASGVTAGIGAVERLITGALRAGFTAVSSVIGRAGSVVTRVIRRVGATVRAAVAKITRTLTAIVGRISRTLGHLLRAVVFPALDRLRAGASRHLVAGHRKAVAAVKANTDHHLAMLDKVARLAPTGPDQGGPAGAGAGDEPVATIQQIGNRARENNTVVVDLFGGRLRSVVASVVDMARRGVGEVGQRLSGAVAQVASTVRSRVGQAVGALRAVGAAVSAFVGSIAASVRGALGGVVGWLRDVAARPAEQLVAFGTGAVTKARNFIGSLVRNVASGNLSLPGLGLGRFRPKASTGPVPTAAATSAFASSSGGVLSALGTVAAAIVGIVLLPALFAGALGLVVAALAMLLVFAPLLALVALLYGLYRLGKWIFTPSKLAVEHQTNLQAPNGAPETRVEVGVGEKVRFTSNKKGKWKATDGSPSSGPTNDAFAWTAPDRKGAATISIDAGGEGTEQVEFKVVQPQDISARREGVISYPAGQQGAGMILDFTYLPTSVSFGRVSAREVAGPASELEGYYANDGLDHFHRPKSNEFFPLGEDNRPTGGVRDRATQYGMPPKWYKGRFVWKIPNLFLVAGEDGYGAKFATTTQEFLMADETGKTTINKAGATVTRAP